MVGLEKVAFCVLLHILYARQPHKISFFKRHLCQATSNLMYARKRADLTQKTCRTWQTYAIAKFLHAQQSFQNSLRFPPAFHISFSAPWYNCLVPILSLFYFFVLKSFTVLRYFFLFLNEHRVGCSWCQPYRRYFFCIYMCISLFMKDIFGRTWHQPHCLYFFWFLQVWAADASAKLPYTWLAS